MSGHSKWATTKRKKAAVDAKRSASFTKLANAISIAARDGGDPSMNFSLRLAVDRAKAASMPKENIERAIKRGTGELGGAAIEEIVYEGYGPGGVAILIQCLTDNRQRTVASIRSLFNKFGGSLAEAGSVAYLFEKRGQIIVNLSDVDLSQEELETAILESGADDYENDDGVYVIYTSFDNVAAVSKNLEDTGAKIDSLEIIHQPKTTISVSEEKITSVEKLIETLESDDDIVNVYANMD